LLTVVLVCVYRYHYIAPPVSKAVVPFRPAPLLSLLVFKPLYAVGVLGGLAALQNGPWLFILGIALVAFFLYVGRLGFFRRNPAILYCSAFIVLTAMGMAHVRMVNGLQFAGSSRYRMYGAVLVAFAWAAVAERWVLHEQDTLPTPLRRSKLYITAVVLSFLHLALAAHRSHGFLQDRSERYILGMSRYQHPGAPHAETGPLPGDFGADQSSQLRFTRRILDWSIPLGVYRPTLYPPPSQLQFAPHLDH
jgi:asparagine N-glycosylation enzyme membrane subunit Stt3